MQNHGAAYTRGVSSLRAKRSNPGINCWIASLGFALLAMTTIFLDFASALDPCPLPHTPGTVRLAGGTAHIPLIEELGQGLRKKCPGLRFLLEGGGSGVGVQK